MIPILYPKEDQGSRVIDLTDGRVLFLPRGRGGPAYVVADYLEGYKLEDRLKWVERIAAYASLAVFAAAGLLDRWILLGFILPLLAVPRIAESVLVGKLPPATDLKARVEVEPADPGEVGWGAVLLLVGGAGWWYYLWSFRDPDLSRHTLDLAIGGCGLLAMAAQLFRQYRATQERRITTVSGDPENKPITPR